MKIWYQSLSQIGHDPGYDPYEVNLKAYVDIVARPGTQVDVYGVKKKAPNMVKSDFIQHLHVGQVIDNALKAEREGYDAFCVGGSLDLGYACLKEVLDIPVAFITESAYMSACLVARTFGIIGISEQNLRRKMQLVRDYGLTERCTPGAHLNSENSAIIDSFARDPQSFIDNFTKAARQVIAGGAGVLIPSYGAMGSFLSKQGITTIDNIPIIDIVAVLIKTTEMLVDLKALGLKQSRASWNNHASKEELLAAMRIYSA